MARYSNILQAVGRTPLVRLERLGAGLASPLYAKVESLNPGGSVKDRAARQIVLAAEPARARSSRARPATPASAWRWWPGPAATRATS